MTHIDHAPIGVPSLNVYAKPIVEPGVFATPWADDAFAGTDPSGTGIYRFEGLADDSDYVVFERAGASPADTDQPIATLNKPITASGGGGTIQISTSGTNVSSC